MQNPNETGKGEKCTNWYKIILIYISTVYHHVFPAIHHPVCSVVTLHCHHSAWPHSDIQTSNSDGLIYLTSAAQFWWPLSFSSWWKYHSNVVEWIVHQRPPSAQIDGACNWRPLCVIAKINRHCYRHRRSMSHTKYARERLEIIGHYIHQQHSNYFYWQDLRLTHQILLYYT